MLILLCFLGPSLPYLKRSCPAVSQIWSFTDLPPTFTTLLPNSTPIVWLESCLTEAMTQVVVLILKNSFLVWIARNFGVQEYFTYITAATIMVEVNQAKATENPWPPAGCCEIVPRIHGQGGRQHEVYLNFQRPHWHRGSADIHMSVLCDVAPWPHRPQKSHIFTQNSKYKIGVYKNPRLSKIFFMM